MIIYQITNKITNDFYIGKTKKPKDRFYQHKYNAIKNKSQAHIHRSMRKYGLDNFIFTLLDEANSIEELNRKEIEWITKLSPKYNMTKGGDGGDTSNSPNYKLAIKNRDQTGPKNGMYGRKRIIPKQQLDNAHKSAQIANRCPVSCNGRIFSSVGEAQIAFPGISIRKRLDSIKYPTFFRLRPKTTRI